MNKLQLLVTVSLATANLVTIPAVANAFTLSHVSTDADYLSIVKDDAFVAEGRYGAPNSTRTYELDIHTIDEQNNNRFLIHSQKEIQSWGNGQANPFSLTYDATTKLATYLTMGQTLTYTVQNDFSDIFIRTRAAASGSSLLVNNLVLNGTTISDSSLAQQSGTGLDYLRISGVTGSFALTGNSTMTWGATTPRDSNLAYQIKVVSVKESVSVPEPTSTLGLLFTAGAMSGLTLVRRQRKA